VGPEPTAPAGIGGAPARAAVLGSGKASGSVSPTAVRPCPHPRRCQEPWGAPRLLPLADGALWALPVLQAR